LTKTILQFRFGSFLASFFGAVAEGKFLKRLVEKCASDIDLLWQEISFDKEHLAANREGTIENTPKKQRNCERL